MFVTNVEEKLTVRESQYPRKAKDSFKDDDTIEKKKGETTTNVDAKPVQGRFFVVIILSALRDQ